MRNKLPKIIVAGVIQKDQSFFLLQEQMSDKTPRWLIPGGKVEFGESLEQALKREIKEETGLSIDIIKLLGHKEVIFTPHNYHTVIFFYQTLFKAGEISLEKKALDGKFFSRAEIGNLELVDSAKWVFDNFFNL